MGPGRGFRGAKREKLRWLRYLLGNAMIRDEDHGGVDRPKVYKHDGRTTPGCPHLFEDFI